MESISGGVKPGVGGAGHAFPLLEPRRLNKPGSDSSNPSMNAGTQLKVPNRIMPLPGNLVRRFVNTVVAPVIILCFVLQGVAHADRVDRLVRQLRKSKDYKVRLSAASGLAKYGDRRVIPALIRALKDKDKNVRGVAATSLAKSAKKSDSKKLRKQARTALSKAAKKDKNAFVRRQAKRALKDLAKSSDGKGGKAGIYVNVGAMTDKANGDNDMRKLMRKTIAKTIAKKASAMTTEWPGGKAPSAKQLRAKKAKGFHVDGTLVSLSAEPKGSMTLVSCKISMLIATYPKKSMFGFLDGGAKVQAGQSERDIKYAQEDCVAAVVEDLVARKIIPTIKSREKP